MASFLSAVALLVAVLVTGHNCSSFTCKRHLTEYPGSSSGVYLAKTRRGEIVQVYCEMGLNQGGYTFLSPSAVAALTDAELASMITDKSSVLLRVRKTNGEQPFAMLSQLPEYSSLPLKLGLSNFDGYAGPVNRDILGKPFLFLGFLPTAHASSNTVQGLLVNGNRIAFQNCDKNPNSLLAVFPNFRETAPSNYHVPGAVCSSIYARLLPNPSGRAMPDDFFMFGEMHFGGCGCYLQTNRIPDVLGLSVGFR